MDNDHIKILEAYREMYLLEAQKDTTQYGCLMVYLDEAIANKRHKYISDNIPDNVLYEIEMDSTPAHITVLYGFHDDEVTIEEITEFVNMTVKRNIEARLLKISRFDSADYDVLKVDVSSYDLEQLNGQLRNYFDGRVTIQFPNYHPHMTLAYLKKGALPHLNGDITFEGDRAVFNEFVYSTAGMNDYYLIGKDLGNILI